MNSSILSRILIVDDAEENIKLVTEILNRPRKEYEIESAGDGYEALEKVKLFNPDLIMLDVVMPGIDGFEVCRILKEDEKTRLIPIVMITALDSQQDRLRGLDAGAFGRRRHPAAKLAAQPTAAQRAPADKAQPLIFADRQELPFTVAVQQVIQRLQTDEWLPTHVLADVNRKLATVKGARDYGVVIKRGQVDKAETRKLRAAMRKKRGKKIDVFNFGPSIDEIRKKCKKQTGLEAPEKPVFR